MTEAEMAKRATRGAQSLADAATYPEEVLRSILTFCKNHPIHLLLPSRQANSCSLPAGNTTNRPMKRHGKWRSFIYWVDTLAVLVPFPLLQTCHRGC